MLQVSNLSIWQKWEREVFCMSTGGFPGYGYVARSGSAIEINSLFRVCATNGRLGISSGYQLPLLFHFHQLLQHFFATIIMRIEFDLFFIVNDS
jgi:hypothetical protein